MRWTFAIYALIGVFALQDATQRIRLQGDLFFPDGCGVDLDDAGGIGADFATDRVTEPEPTKLSFKGSDFWFRAGKRRYFIPQHGAMFSKSVFNAVGYRECAAATYTKGEICIDELPANAQICVRTSEGRFGSIQITRYDPKERMLYITHVTWEK